MPSIKQKLQGSILRKRGLTKGRYGTMRIASEPTPTPVSKDTTKTTLMRQIEARLGSDIDELLTRPNKTQLQLAELLGVERATISNWRLKRGLRSTKNAYQYTYSGGVPSVESATG